MQSKRGPMSKGYNSSWLPNLVKVKGRHRHREESERVDERKVHAWWELIWAWARCGDIKTTMSDLLRQFHICRCRWVQYGPRGVVLYPSPFTFSHKRTDQFAYICELCEVSPRSDHSGAGRSSTWKHNFFIWFKANRFYRPAIGQQHTYSVFVCWVYCWRPE